MRIAVLSDVHANREAFQEVGKALEGLDIDEVFFLGDIVGYNADPEACVRRLGALTQTAVRGNHDRTVSSLEDLGWFNDAAREVILWTRNALSRDGLQSLTGLGAGPQLVLDRFLICHGSPMDEDLYITRQGDVKRSFSFMDRHAPGARICFFGHTHVPLIVEESGGAWPPPQRFALDSRRRYLINPGSVGQPRDGIPLASFGVLDEEDMVYRQYRVPFPIERVQRKILAAGLPPMLAERLSAGW